MTVLMLLGDAPRASRWHDDSRLPASPRRPRFTVLLSNMKALRSGSGVPAIGTAVGGLLGWIRGVRDVWGLGVMVSRERDLVAGMRRIERKLDLIMARLEIDDVRPELSEVTDLIGRGKKIAAIKAYREATGASLREAKDAVDELADGRRGV
jgi:hypothetical protein